MIMYMNVLSGVITSSLSFLTSVFHRTEDTASIALAWSLSRPHFCVWWWWLRWDSRGHSLGVHLTRSTLSMFMAVVCVEVRKVQVQKLMLISPFLLACCKSFTMIWWWRGICDFGDEICRWCFSNSIDENAKQRDTKEDVEADSKTKEEAFSIVKPALLLLFAEFYARKVWFELN